MIGAGCPVLPLEIGADGLFRSLSPARVWLSSLRREASNALPALSASVVLFVLAAFIEGFVSASPIPYSAKAGVAITSGLLIAAYLTLGGRGDHPRRPDAVASNLGQG